jgi:DDB1- and CUL4-associated factor 13
VQYTRALNAVKLDRLFAKPFIGALDGHSDGVSALATSSKSLVAFISGASDGEIRVWDLPRRKCVWNAYGHKGSVRGLAVAASGSVFYSCSEDKMVKQWSLKVRDDEDDVPQALATFTSKEPFLYVCHDGYHIPRTTETHHGACVSLVALTTTGARTSS